jgi:hypothetical protein
MRPVPVVVRNIPPAAGWPQLPGDGAEVVRTVDSGGSISFAGTTYLAGTSWVGQQVQVAVISQRAQIRARHELIKIHPIRHDRAKNSAPTPPHWATQESWPRSHGPPSPASKGVSSTYRTAMVKRLPEIDRDRSYLRN